MSELEANAQFHYHPRCKRNRITHLMFVDDLLFTQGDLTSVQQIMKKFQKISQCSGYITNQDKCELYCAILTDSAKEFICDQLGM